MNVPSPLPNFLGIGAPRAGTTWLHNLLDAHPDVLMPARRKELSFFDRHHARGLEWYAKSFRVPRDGPLPPRIGEVSPLYMYRRECLPRIEALGTIDRFIVCLRNPSDLILSYYRHRAAITNFGGSVKEFLDIRPDARSFGLYAETMKPWIDRFGEDRFLFLRFEDLASKPDDVKARLARFLGIDPRGFAEAGTERVNQSVAPRFPRLYSLVMRSVMYLYRTDRTWVVNLVKGSGLRRLPEILLSVSSTTDPPGTIADVPAQLLRDCARDLRRFECLTGFDTRQWSRACDVQVS